MSHHNYNNGDTYHQYRSETVRYPTIVGVLPVVLTQSPTFRLRLPHIISAAPLPGVQLVYIWALKSLNMRHHMAIRPRDITHLGVHSTQSRSLLQRQVSSCEYSWGQLTAL